jgi:rubrerythrin
MSITFSGSELIDVAVGIERSGITFYDIMAKSTDDEMTRDIFKRLADMEREHITTFEEMRADADKYELDTTFTDEHADYIQALVDSAVFTDDMITSEIASQADTDIRALELGLTAEKDAIIFYYQMREVMPKPALPTIDRIIAEEKSHLRQLTEVMKKIASQ